MPWAGGKLRTPKRGLWYSSRLWPAVLVSLTWMGALKKEDCSNSWRCWRRSKPSTVAIAASRQERMVWVGTAAGAGAVFSAGTNPSKAVRTALQSLKGQVAKKAIAIRVVSLSALKVSTVRRWLISTSGGRTNQVRCSAKRW